jgi:UDPglucose 6-dehydrogenase
MIGMGKLGLPVALVLENKNNVVKGYDVNPAVQTYLSERQIPFKEEGIEPYLESHDISMVDTIEDLVGWADILFCAVQTPHDPQYEGTTRLPDDRKDFDYSYLQDAVTEVAQAAERLNQETTLVVISTCLPGTYEKHIKPLLNKYVNYIYNPFFIAMGTVIHDFTHPEFVLLGYDRGYPDTWLEGMYRGIHGKPILRTDITTAEAIKVSYNTFITTKTVLANLWGQIAHKTGANVDDIYQAWTLASDRLISARYLQAGMSDGGGCHPRDNIALSWLADEIGLSYNYFEALMKARESHEEWIASLIVDRNIPLPHVIFGKSFKPETNICTGSPAVLLANILTEKGVEYSQYDPYVDDVEINLEQRIVAIIATKHAIFSTYRFKQGSIVFDPFGIIQDQEGVEVIRIGRL